MHSFNDDLWPICLLTLSGSPTEKEFAQYLDELLTHYNKPGKRAYVVDLRKLDGASPNIRKAQSHFFEKNEALVREKNVGMALVVANGLQRGILTALYWLKPFPCPHKIVTDIDEAENYCRGQLVSADA